MNFNVLRRDVYTEKTDGLAISSYPIFSVVLPEFQATHLSSYSNPSNFWVTMPDYFAVNFASHSQLLQPAFTMVILPFKVMV